MTKDATPITANEKLKSDLIEKIIGHENGLLMIGKALAGFNEGGKKAYEDMNLQLEPERSKLRAWSITELQQHLAAKQRRSAENAAIAAHKSAVAKLEKAAKVEASKFYNLPSAHADFDHWSKAEYWTPEESVALLLGRNPRVVSWQTLKPYHPANDPIAFLSGTSSTLAAGFVGDYERLLDLLGRWQTARAATRLIPQEVLDWAKRTDAAQPDPRLIALVAIRQKGNELLAPTSTPAVNDTLSALMPKQRAAKAAKWTDQEIDDLRLFRGTHTLKETQEHYELSGQRIRELLARTESAPVPTANNPFALKKRR